MENQPTLANVRCKQTQAGPKWGWFQVLRAKRRKTALVANPAYSTHLRSHQMDSRNGETRHVLSLPWAGAGDQATCRDGVGCPKKPRSGVMPRIC
jgi:hypothetical protein